MVAGNAVGRRKNSEMDALHINIYLTGQCQHHCNYCYYPRRDAMSSEIGQKLLTWIHDLCAAEQVKLFKAHFLGGEPLENWPVLLQLLDGLVDLPAHPDGKFVLFTNGDLLTVEKLKELRARHVKIMLNPTTDSLAVVDNKMTMIKSHCGGVSLAVVADTVNLPRLVDLTKLAIKYHGHIRINRLYHGGTIPGYVDAFQNQMSLVLDTILEAERPMWPNFIMESTYPLWNSPKNCYSCGRWLLVIDPDGTIRSCNADMDTIIGHIDTHKRASDFKFMQRWSAKQLPECQDCQWVGWCQGGCPFTRKLAYGTYLQRTPFCRAFKELFPKLKLIRDRWVTVHGMEQ